MMNALYAPMEEMEAFQQIRRRMQKKQNTGMILAGGCIDSQKAHLIGCLARDYPVTCIIAPDDLRAKEICENYRIFDEHVLLYPARDFLFFQADLQSRTLTAQRVRCMKALADITTGLESDRVTVVLTLRALMSHCMKAEDWMDAIISYTAGDEIDPQEEKKALSLMGYERVDMVEAPGQFASRGGILDIYPLTEENPVRIELWGDEIDSVRYFDAESQRTKEQLQGIRIYPASEFVTTTSITQRGLKKISAQARDLEQKLRSMQKSEEAFRAARIAADARQRLEDFGDTSVMEGLCDFFYPDAVSLLDFFPDGTVFFMDEPSRSSQSTKEAEEEFRDSLSHRLEKGYVLPGQAKMLFTGKQIEERLSARGLVGLTAHSGAKCPFPVSARIEIQAAGCGVYNSNFELLVKDLARYKRQKYRVVLLCASRTRGQRLARDLTDNGVIAFYSEKEDRVLQGGEVMVTYGNTHRGYEYPMLKFAVLSESDIFGRERKKKRRAAPKSGRPQGDLLSGCFREGLRKTRARERPPGGIKIPVRPANAQGLHMRERQTHGRGKRLFAPGGRHGHQIRISEHIAPIGGRNVIRGIVPEPLQTPAGVPKLHHLRCGSFFLVACRRSARTKAAGSPAGCHDARPQRPPGKDPRAANSTVCTRRAGSDSGEPF